MITSIFNKSKSIILIIVFLVVLLAFFLGKVEVVNQEPNGNFISNQALRLFIIYASIFLLNFIVSKNSLTKKNNYEILIFGLLMLAINQTTSQLNVLMSNFFVLLALRRIMSLRSQKETKKKLFDAAFWIAIATLFYFWSVLFFALILMALAFYSDNNLRHWLVPFLGVIIVFVLAVTISIVIYDNYFTIFNISPNISYDYSYYNTAKYVVIISFLVLFGLWSSVFYLNNIKKKKKAFRASFKIIILAAIIAVSIVILVANKNGGEFLFLFAPLAIIITNYMETIQKKWFKEVFLGLLIVTPFITLLL